MIHVLVMLFNVVVVGLLIYHLLRLNSLNIEPSRKRIILITGIVLLLLPVTMLLRFIPAGLLYFFIYPLGIALFISLTWNEGKKE
jgi:chromate transport protein ChrA